MDINARNVRENRQILQFSGYSYQDLKNDLHIYSRIFEKIVQITTLARTTDGREIFQARIGKPDARHKILIFAGIHGREYMTCQLLMDLTASFARAILEKQTYRGYSYQTFFDTCSLFLLPMVNPDGVTISQMGPDALNKEENRRRVWEIARREGARMPWKQYFKYWKSNAEGIDVNRNFDALWESYYDGVQKPASEHYKGPSAGCTLEADTLIQLTLKEKFDRTISYHSSGAVIYWSFGQRGELAKKHSPSPKEFLTLPAILPMTIMKNLTRQAIKTGHF